MKLSRESILETKDVITEEVAVPEWGGEVLVRGLSGRERDEFEASILQRRGKRMVPDVANVRARLVCWCVVDEDGNKLFDVGDIQALGEKSGAAISRVYDVAAKLSGLTDDDIEEMVEDFDATGSSPSPSTSRGNSGKPGRSSSATQTPTS